MIKQIIQKIRDQRLLHYATSGSSAFAIEYSSFLILFYHYHITAVIANTVSFVLGFTTSFILNRLWVFGQKEQTKQVLHQISLYLVIAFINLAITDIAIHFLVNAHVPAFIAKIILVIIVACWNFIIFKKIIFTHRNLSAGQDST